MEEVDFSREKVMLKISNIQNLKIFKTFFIFAIMAIIVCMADLSYGGNHMSYVQNLADEIKNSNSFDITH
ncbi:MAG: hypothetical protein L6420_08390 [Elusimicrobia bacterium]|nr:hypothetical protein [Elusimicrobiota bacterium]